MRLRLMFAFLFTCIHFTGCKIKSIKKNYRSSQQSAASSSIQQKAKVGVQMEMSQNLIGVQVSMVRVRLICDNLPEGHIDQQDLDIANGDKIEVFGVPTGCFVKLLAFSTGSQTFRPKQDFITHTPGSTAVFESDLGDLNVKIVKQPPATLDKDADVEFHISVLVQSCRRLFYYFDI